MFGSPEGRLAARGFDFYPRAGIYSGFESLEIGLISLVSANFTVGFPEIFGKFLGRGS